VGYEPFAKIRGGRRYGKDGDELGKWWEVKEGTPELVSASDMH